MKAKAMKKIKIGIIGASGRMGRLIAEEIKTSQDCELACAIAHKDSKHLGQDLGGVAITASFDVLGACDAVVEFTKADSMIANARAAEKFKKPLVSGTSGASHAQMQELQNIAQVIPVFHALNMSLGVFVMNQLLSEAAKKLPPEFQIEIVETHHNKKLDAPSGTAFLFARSMAESRGLSEKDFCYGREGQTGARGDKEIGIHALRMGNVVGEHDVHFASPYERLQFTHRALNRAVFAKGALDAARWIIGKGPGLYGMKDRAK